MKPPMDAERLKQIRERERRATKGPWEADYANCTSANVKGPVDEDKVHADYGGRAQYLTEDAEFIAHARQDIPDLLAEVERLQRLIAQAILAARGRADVPDGAIVLHRALGEPDYAELVRLASRRRRP